MGAELYDGLTASDAVLLRKLTDPAFEPELRDALLAPMLAKTPPAGLAILRHVSAHLRRVARGRAPARAREDLGGRAGALLVDARPAGAFLRDVVVAARRAERLDAAAALPALEPALADGLDPRRGGADGERDRQQPHRLAPASPDLTSGPDLREARHGRPYTLQL